MTLRREGTRDFVLAIQGIILRNEGEGWLLRLGRAFGQLYNGAVGDFPAETFHLLLVMEMLFEKY